MLTDPAKRAELETRINNWQMRGMGTSTYEEMEELVDFTAAACKASEPLPVWLIAMRQLVGRIRRERAYIDRMKAEGKLPANA